MLDPDEELEEDETCEFCGEPVDDCTCDAEDDYPDPAGVEAAERAAYNDRHG